MNQEAGIDIRGSGGVLLTDLGPLGCSDCLLIEPTTSSPWVVQPTMVRALHPQSLIKKIPFRASYNLILWRHFFLKKIEISYSEITLACVTLT